MKIEINITGTENLSDAINNLAQAIGGFKTVSVGKVSTSENTVPFTKPEALTCEAPAKDESDAPKLSAGEQKQIIADQIKALGFEPPEKGTLATFQKALEEAQTKPAQEKPETTATPPESATDEPEEDEQEEITEDSTRKLAVFLIENHPDPSLAKTIFGAILKKANVKAITGANDQALALIYPRLHAEVAKLQAPTQTTPEDEDGL